jgi:Family of unknown function (DUF5996)
MTSLVPDAAGIEIFFDFVNHAVIGQAARGRKAEIPHCPMAVAQFHTQFRDLIERLGGTPEFHGPPNEIPDAMTANHGLTMPRAWNVSSTPSSQ